MCSVNDMYVLGMKFVLMTIKRTHSDSVKGEKAASIMTQKDTFHTHC